MNGVEIEARRYDHPDAVELTAQVQQEYVVRYGGEDETPVDPGEFAPPGGLFLVGYADGVPVASGGWRARESDDEGFADGDAEIKRMYVSPDARGRGHARRILAALEDGAREAGRTRMVLESGLKQPEALGLYRSCGYSDVTKFGVYRFEELSVCLGKSLAGGPVLRQPLDDRVRPEHTRYRPHRHGGTGGTAARTTGRTAGGDR